MHSIDLSDIITFFFIDFKMKNFDDLTNEQLRLKMLEYGMTDITVTSRTRKRVIKELKTLVENPNRKPAETPPTKTRIPTKNLVENADIPITSTNRKLSSNNCEVRRFSFDLPFSTTLLFSVSSWKISIASPMLNYV